MVLPLACSGIYISEDSDFQNILNFEEPSLSLSPFLSFFFFFFPYPYYFASCFTIIDLLLFKQSTISFLSIPSTCKFSKNSSSSAPFPIPKAFRSFFLSFFYFLSYFSTLFFFYFLLFTYFSSSDDYILAFFISSSSYSEDDEDLGIARSSSSLTHKLLSSQTLLFPFFLATPPSVYLLNNFFFFSAQFICTIFIYNRCAGTIKPKILFRKQYYRI